MRFLTLSIVVLALASVAYVSIITPSSAAVFADGGKPAAMRSMR